MPHTESRFQQDLGFGDGRFFISPIQFDVSGTTVMTRNAAGDWSLNQAATQTVFYAVNLTSMLRRVGFGEDIQTQFGGTGIPGSAQVSPYRPDVIASMSTAQQLQPRTALKQKGVKILSFDVVYLISAVNLTTNTARIDQTLFVNGVANAITSVLAVGANGLQTAFSATPYVTNVPLPAAQQIYRTSVDQELWMELNIVTPAGGTYRLYGVDVNFEFNFN